ncbi:MAG: patatin-like phospholipase/acyl hydrolase [Limisphaerales bacterium]|jgi:patatin-like phospholipase/acyl hydrolase
MPTRAKKKPIRILSIDGGGIRGILPGQLDPLLGDAAQEMDDADEEKLLLTIYRWEWT